MNEGDCLGNKVTELITKVYHHFLVCFYFWFGLFRGALIYALVPALVALYLTLDYMKQNSDYGEIDLKKTYRSAYKKFQHHKLSSFLVSFAFIILASLVFFLIKGGANWVWVGIVGYFILLLFTTVCYATYYIAFKATAIKDSFVLGFVSVIKNLSLTLSIISLFALMVWLAFYNLVLFFVLSPVLFGVVIVYIFPKRLHN